MAFALLPYIYVGLGIVLLGFGADHMVRGAVDLAQRLGIPTLVIGLTVVAMGTSLPEFVVCVDAALKGASGIAVGNVVGSNIANILFILGSGALIFPIASQRRLFMRDSSILVAATALFVLILLSGSTTRWHGALMLALLVCFLIFSYVRGKHHGADEIAIVDIDEATGARQMVLWLAIVYVVGGLTAVAFGAELLVDGSVSLARNFGVSEEVIGLTVVAIGTSLPELATVIAASIKGHTDVILGNVIGSNIFNILGVMGATALVTEVTVAQQIYTFDIWIMVGITLALVPLMMTSNRINRVEGSAMLFMYLAYVTVQYVGVDKVF